MLLMLQDDVTNHDIDVDESEGQSDDTRETTLSSDIEDDDFNCPQQVLLLGQPRYDKSAQTKRVPLPKHRSCADTVVARPLLPNPRKPPGSMAPPLLNRQMSALLNK
jgi:hypothetical protein